MKAEGAWVCAGDEPPGAYSTSTPLMLFPGTLGSTWSKTTVTLASLLAASAPVTEIAAKAAAKMSVLIIEFSWLRGSKGLILADGALEPIVVTHRTDARIVAGHKRAIVELDAEIECMRVRDRGARVVGRFEILRHSITHAHAIGPGDLDHAVHRRAEGDIGHDIRHAVRCDPRA